jgi:hypothetical protein
MRLKDFYSNVQIEYCLRQRPLGLKCNIGHAPSAKIIFLQEILNPKSGSALTSQSRSSDLFYHTESPWERIHAGKVRCNIRSMDQPKLFLEKATDLSLILYGGTLL